MPAEVIEEVCSAEEVAKVRQFTLRSYVEDSRKLTWCPAPGCEHAVECTADIGAEPLDVTCNCGSTFCFTCKEEAHRPVRMCSCLEFTRRLVEWCPNLPGQFQHPQSSAVFAPALV